MTNNNSIQYSSIIKMDLRSLAVNGIKVLPNPVRDVMQLQISSSADSKVRVDIFDQNGKMVITERTFVQRGNTTMTIEDLSNYPRGVYMVLVTLGEEIFREKVLHIR